MIEFGNPAETARAMMLSVTLLPRLLRAFENGLADLGVQIVSRSHYRDRSGAAVPVILARHGNLRFRVELRNALEDLLTEDREVRPVRVDARLDDPDYAAAKLGDLVRDRLELVRTIVEEGVGGAQARIEQLADRFEWIRTAYRDGAGEEDA